MRIWPPSLRTYARGIGTYCKDDVLNSFKRFFPYINELWTGGKYCETEMAGTDYEQTHCEFLLSSSSGRAQDEYAMKGHKEERSTSP